MKIQDYLSLFKIDAILVSSQENIKYISDFSGTEATLIISASNMWLMVDSRYTLQAKKQATNANVIEYNQGNYYSLLIDILSNNNLNSIGFEQMYTSVAKYKILENKLNDYKLLGLNIDKIREIKKPIEIENIKKACQITDEAFSYFLEEIKVGISEKELNQKLLLFVINKGASAFSFDTIIASGKRSSMPHGVASDKLIQKNDFVTLDFGVYYNGYVSDMTRTICMSKYPDAKLVEVYQIVLDAQLKAIEAIKPGVMACEIDKVARDYITSKGYGKNFSHGLGHSIGMKIHETPNVNPSSKDILKPGMIITIEPGIYIDGLGGVRIEDDVLITENGYEILNKSTKELITIERN
ncbi:M24 family metallopeptidase [Mycoplasma sp. P36-A1]|uniref:M24 family metallopeptidase n=1 Tax=Mycoplasma sp. P36-A1 TaxID=3252900 RepID=UPI003C2BFE10